jgi:hypothetical protein
MLFVGVPQRWHGAEVLTVTIVSLRWRCAIPVHVFAVGDVLAAQDVNTWLAPIAGVKSANQVVSSTTTLINDADMRFAVAANSIYEFHVYLRYSSPSGADWKSSFTVPAGAGARFCRIGNNLSGSLVGSSEALDTDTLTSQGQGASTILNANFFGTLFTGGTAGNLIFQWAPNTSNAGNTTLYQYSYLSGRRIS